jgi:hypothetical protein
MTKQLIPGANLTNEQKAMLKFKGMANPEWVKSHSFYFIDGKPATIESGFYYPVCKSLAFLPY